MYKRQRINVVLMGDKLVGKIRIMKATGSQSSSEPLETPPAGSWDSDTDQPPILHEIVQTVLRKNPPPDIFEKEDDATAALPESEPSKPDEGTKVELRVRIAYGGEDQRLDHAFRGGSVVGICYDVNREVTLMNVLEKWFPIAAYFAPHLPIVLIGVVLPRAYSPGVKLIDPKVVKMVLDRTGSVCSVKCSTRGVKAGHTAFETLAWIGNDYEQASKSLRDGTAMKSDEIEEPGCTIA